MNPHHPKPGSRGPERRSILLGACALALAGCSRSTDSESSPAEPDGRALPQPGADAAEKIVTMLGDSITAGFGLASADALPARLESALRAKGISVRVRAAGLSGDTTAGGLARVDFSVMDDTDLCIVALGGNDMLQGLDPSTVRSNLQAIMDRLKVRGIPVLLVGMRAPAQYGTYTGEFDRVFTDLAEDENVAVYPFLLDGVALDRRYNQADGIHPNAEGVRIIVTGLAPVVQQALAGD